MAGGLTKIKIPNPKQPQQWTTLTDPHQIDQELLKYCQEHFSKSFGTPYTVPPLSNLLDYDGITQFGQTVLNGTADLSLLNLNHHTKLLLQHQKYCTPANILKYQELPYNSLMQGFHKWKERTTTSPSGRHLGIYKALLKDDHHNKKKNTQQKLAKQITTTTSTNNSTTPPDQNGSDVMHMIHQLLTLAI